MLDSEFPYLAVRSLFGQDNTVEMRVGEHWYQIPIEEILDLRWKLGDLIRELGLSPVV